MSQVKKMLIDKMNEQQEKEYQKQIEAAWQEREKTLAYCPECAWSCEVVDMTLEGENIYECIVCKFKFSFEIYREENG